MPRQLKIEKELLSHLTANEQKMMNKGFSICDIVWSRFNSEKLYIKSYSELYDYYCNLHEYARIMEHEKDFERATAINVQTTILECSGMDFQAMENNELKYVQPKDLVVYGGSVSSIINCIEKKYVTRKYVESLCTKMDHFLPKTFLPVRYVSGPDVMAVVDSFIEHRKVDPTFYCTLDYVLADYDFTKKLMFW